VKLSTFKELYLSQFLSDLDDPFDQLIRITYVILSPLLGNGPRNEAYTLKLRDLKIHHPTADPLRVLKVDEIATSTPYFDRATELGFTLLNVPGVFTWFSMSLIGRPSVLDLAFACPVLAPIFRNGPTPSPPPAPTIFQSSSPVKLLSFAHTPPAPNLALTDWPALAS